MSGTRLISASADWMIKAWSLDSWACVLTATAGSPSCPEPQWQPLSCVAVWGPFLVGGAGREEDEESGCGGGFGGGGGGDSLHSLQAVSVLRVWDLETLGLIMTLSLPQEALGVMDIEREDEQMWAAAGHHVMVWRRR